MTFIIERRFATAGLVFAVTSLAATFGVIHSLLATGALFWPWEASAPRDVALRLAGTYGVLASLCWLAGRRTEHTAPEPGC